MLLLKKKYDSIAVEELIAISRVAVHYKVLVERNVKAIDNNDETIRTHSIARAPLQYNKVP
jgi:hypothetical protein